MTAGELREKLKDVPDDAFVYLDDSYMPTPMGLSKVEFEVCDGFQRMTTETGRISDAFIPIKINVVTLTATTVRR